MKCPKCKYIKNEKNAVPDWQCANCGIALEKYNSILEVSDNQQREYVRKNNLEKTINKKLMRPVYGLIVISIFYIIVADDVGDFGGAIFWFMLSALASFSAYQMKSTGYFLGPFCRLMQREEHRVEFMINYCVIQLGSLAAFIVGIRYLN